MLDKVSGAKLELDAAASHDQAALPGNDLKTERSANRMAVSVALSVLQALLVVGVVVLSLFVADRMIANKPEKRQRPAFKTVYTVDSITVRAGDHQPVFTVYGQTVAARNVDLRALVAGEIVKVSNKLRAGARVAKGDPLITIDDFNYRGALAEARANLAEAEAKIVENDAQIALERSRLKSAEEQLSFAKDDLVRTQQLRTRGAATQQKLDERKFVVSQREQARDTSRNMIKVNQSRIAQLEANIARLNWRVERAQRDLESTVLVAPFSGVVRSSSAESGRNVTANDVVVSLYEAETLEVKFTLTDAQYGRLQSAGGQLIGRKVDVSWTVGGKRYDYPATIDRAGAEITSNRGGVEMFALVSKTNDGITIRPGAFVEIQVPDVVFSNTIAVPETALYGTQTIYTIVDGKLVENAVEVVAFDGGKVVISKGLSAGDEVLTTKITEVSAGLLVRTEDEAPPDKSQASGPPSADEIAGILKANNLSREEFRALSRKDRGKLMRKYRADNAVVD